MAPLSLFATRRLARAPPTPTRGGRVSFPFVAASADLGNGGRYGSTFLFILSGSPSGSSASATHEFATRLAIPEVCRPNVGSVCRKPTAPRSSPAKNSARPKSLAHAICSRSAAPVVLSLDRRCLLLNMHGRV